MDYKYIIQLLERYWRCETSLEEEDILRAFFSQDNIPAALLCYKPLFNYREQQSDEDVLDDRFDDRIMAIIEESQPVKARIITMTQRLRPLFKAAAVVAIILTLGNAMQVSFGNGAKDTISSYDGYSMPEIQKGNSVAMGDSAMVDTMKQSMVEPKVSVDQPIIK
ncbi:MAG: pyruvate ferredoxin oxidoreductase [Prevotella sp.]|nr:pyruvate ferredoxin oxidoreductase [Prevotella sp.]